MSSYNNIESVIDLAELFKSPNSSVRLSTALSAGTNPKPEFVVELINQCAVEPDFFVRDMLTWALLRQEQILVFENLQAQLISTIPQARSQALHTLTKLGHPETWPLITDTLLFDPEVEVRRAAWRLASQIVPEGQRNPLLEKFLKYLGSGNEEEKLSLSRAIAALGDIGIVRLEVLLHDSEPEIVSHAQFTLALINNPEIAEASSTALATKIDLLSKAPRPSEQT